MQVYILLIAVIASQASGFLLSRAQLQNMGQNMGQNLQNGISFMSGNRQQKVEYVPIPVQTQQPQQWEYVIVNENQAQQLPAGWEYVIIETPQQFQQYYGQWNNNGPYPQEQYVIIENNGQMYQVPLQMYEQWQQVQYFGIRNLPGQGTPTVLGLNRDMAQELDRRNQIIRSNNMQNAQEVPQQQQQQGRQVMAVKTVTVKK